MKIKMDDIQEDSFSCLKTCRILFLHFCHLKYIQVVSISVFLAFVVSSYVHVSINYKLGNLRLCGD